jgi:hypothetical protein
MGPAVGEISEVARQTRKLVQEGLAPDNVIADG